MKTLIHETKSQKVAEIVGDGLFIKNVDDAFQIMMDHAYADVRSVIFHKSNVAPEFFDLKTRLLGELLQKAVNYKVKIAFVGDFSNAQSKSLSAFIIESNRGTQNFFATDVAAALEYFG